jgi:hypothetical protein
MIASSTKRRHRTMLPTLSGVYPSTAVGVRSMAVNNIPLSNSVGYKKCGTCGETKSVTEFFKRGDGLNNYRSDCKDCHIQKNNPHSLACHKRKNIEDPTRYSNNRRRAYVRARSEFLDCMRMAFHVRRRQCEAKGIVFEITPEYVKDVYEMQDGLCALTGRKLLWGQGGWHRDTLSVDRIEASLGYVEGNIRLVTYQANRARGEFTDGQFLQFCQDVIATLSGKVEPDSSVPEVVNIKPAPPIVRRLSSPRIKHSSVLEI